MRFNDNNTFAGELRTIRERARSEAEKGRWFEALSKRLLSLPETGFQFRQVWFWADWPDREKLTGRNAKDTGVDLVGQDAEGLLVAIQCKCYDDNARVAKPEVDSFLSASNIHSSGGTGANALVDSEHLFGWRLLITTAELNNHARDTVDEINRFAGIPHVKVLNFHQHGHHKIGDIAKVREVRELKPMQREAFSHVVKGLTNADRGKLIMACGTGKTFTALRIMEHIAARGGGGGGGSTCPFRRAINCLGFPSPIGVA